MKIIVNADDLGMDEATNDEIFKLMSLNKVTSATMMANAPCLEEAVREARRFSQCSFGVHLNLTEFPPLTDKKGLQPLLDASGHFVSENEDLKVTRAMLKVIIKELSEQIRMIQSYGVNVSHIDSHQHIHTNPSMFPVVKYLQHKFNIKKIRLTREYPDTGEYGYKMLSKKKVYNFALRHFARSITTDGFSSLIGFVNNAERIQIKCKTFEIMVHPGKNEKEDKVLNSDWAMAAPFGIELMNYNLL